MTTRWSYRLAVGELGAAVDWQTYSDDPAPADFTTGGQPGLLLEGLALSRSLPDDEPWPCQPNPETLTFQVAAETAAELSGQLPKGARVAYAMHQWNPAAGGSWVLAEWMTGYISDTELEARGDYTVATVTAMAHIAALGEVTIGDEPWPLEAAQTRINRVFGLVYAEAPELATGWDYEDLATTPVTGDHVGLAPTDVDNRTALAVILEALASWVIGGVGVNPAEGRYSRFRLIPWHATWAADVAQGAATFTNLLRLDGWRVRAHTVAPGDQPPALFGETAPNVWGVVMTPHADVPMVSADTVELPARWKQRIGDVPNVSAVTVVFTGYTAGNDMYTMRWKLPQAQRKPRVLIKRTVPLEFSVANDATYQSGVDATFKLAFLLIPDAIHPATSWGTDDLTWRASVEDGYRAWPWGLGRLITVYDVPPASHPAATPWLHNQQVAYTVKIIGGFPEVEFTTKAQLRDSIHADVLTLGGLPAGVTLAELDPDTTLHDLRLLRATP